MRKKNYLPYSLYSQNSLYESEIENEGQCWTRKKIKYNMIKGDIKVINTVPTSWVKNNKKSA